MILIHCYSLKLLPYVTIMDIKRELEGQWGDTFGINIKR